MICLYKRFFKPQIKTIPKLTLLMSYSFIHNFKETALFALKPDYKSREKGI